VAKSPEKDCIAVEKMERSSDSIRILMFYRHVPDAQHAAGIKYNHLFPKPHPYADVRIVRADGRGDWSSRRIREMIIHF
jgi:hypothetical protein